MSASAACSDPTWTWFSPRLPRKKTSHRGMIAAPIDSRFPSLRFGGALATGRSLRSLASSLRSCRDRSSRERSSPRGSVIGGRLGPVGRQLGLSGVGHGCLADPGTLVVGAAALGDALGVARTVAADHALELGPVGLAEAVGHARLVS